jgi:hypothetical protein
MSQDLTVNIKTTSDVPQAMDKSKTAVVSFSKQVEDIQKKFSTSFKDIFLSFLGPMALLTGALALIGKMIADNEKKRAEANRAAIDGTNDLMSAEDKYWARKNERENQSKEKSEQQVMTREQVTEEYLSKDPRGKQLWKDIQAGKSEIKPFTASWRAIKNPEVQAKVQAMIAEDMKKNPEAGAAFDDKNKDNKAGSFKGPEGFGTVVGVGANPVMEKMTRQNEILEEIKIILQEQSLINRGGMVPSPFTEAVPLTLQKMGAV